VKHDDQEDTVALSATIVSADSVAADLVRPLLSEGNLAARIKDERQARGWSQELLAKLMTDRGSPMHQTSIAKIERANGPRRPITVSEAIRFAELFEVPVQDLLLDAVAWRDVRVRALQQEAAQIADEIKARTARLGEIGQEISELTRQPGGDDHGSR